jgi:putative ABC transport system substrate-binding protein
VGLLVGTSPGASPRPLFWQRLAELGYVEGQNLVREERGPGAYADRAAELVRLPVDVIAASLDPAVRAAVEATSSIPIVMMGSTLDPIGEGWVESLARPGRNVTGMAGVPPEVELKRLQLLVEAVPGITRVAVLTAGASLPEETWRSAATYLGVGLLMVQVGEGGYREAIERAVSEGADALLTRAGLGAAPNAALIRDLAERHRLPVIYFQRQFVAGGGLMAYEARGSELNRRAAEYVDRILRGARPADLPVELPTRYDLIVNLRAARALGLTLSRDFLAQIDEVIE